MSGFAVNFLALGVTGYLFSDLYPGGIETSEVSRVPTLSLNFLDSIPGIGNFLHDVFGGLSLLVWMMFADGRAHLLRAVQDAYRPADPLRRRASPGGGHRRHLRLRRSATLAVTTSGMLAALGGAFLSIGFVGTFSENMTSGRGFIALAAVIFGKWRPGLAFLATLLFGFGFALAIPLQREAGISENLVSTFPYILTLVAVAGLIGRSIPPAADGRPYVKQ